MKPVLLFSFKFHCQLKVFLNSLLSVYTFTTGKQSWEATLKSTTNWNKLFCLPSNHLELKSCLITLITNINQNTCENVKNKNRKSFYSEQNVQQNQTWHTE